MIVQTWQSRRVAISGCRAVHQENASIRSRRRRAAGETRTHRGTARCSARLLCPSVIGPVSSGTRAKQVRRPASERPHNRVPETMLQAPRCRTPRLVALSSSVRGPWPTWPESKVRTGPASGLAGGAFLGWSIILRPHHRAPGALMHEPGASSRTHQWPTDHSVPSGSSSQANLSAGCPATEFWQLNPHK
jgi:hypothetical protein